MRGKRRLPEERVSNVAGLLPPCRVCGEEAAGFHYGVNTCEACKGFFRRSLLRNGDYECLGAGNCVIGPNRRKSCPKCRYLKCLSVGMSTEAIKTGRYTYMKRTQDTLELKTLKQAKQKHISEFVLDNDSSPKEILAESSVHPSKQRSLFEGVNKGDSFTSNSCSCLSPSTESSLSSSPVLESVLPSVPVVRQSLIDLMPNLSAELMSTSTHLSQKDTLNRKMTDDLKNTGSKCNNPINLSLMTCDPKLPSTQCSELFSDFSVKETSDSSPDPKTIFHHHSPNCLENSSFAANLHSSLPHSSLASPSQLQQEQGLNKWHMYSESELDEFISVMVSGHKAHVEDVNSISDEVLQEMFKECKERCSLQTEVFGHLGVIQKDEHDQIYTSTGLDVDGRLDNLSYAAQKLDVYVRQMISFMKLIPGFRSLSLSDQTALVTANFCDLIILACFRGYCRDDLIVVEASRSYCRHEMVLFNTAQDLDTLFQIAQRLQNLHLTFEMVVVLKALCVFFSDRATLEDPDTIEQLQFTIVQCLLLLLQRHYPHEKGLMFARILSILAQMRNHAEDCGKFIVSNMMSGSYVERFYNVPIMFEFLIAHLNS